ncbi:MAG: type II toxin-antitoxin system RelE/ParE family toxin [Acidobacteria bacterium]|nr:type II toxin-antitoxin system RelE/ParE family toxin [Acidobacteriota bacterium]
MTSSTPDCHEVTASGRCRTLVGPRVANPRPVGRALGNELFGLDSVRVGIYRIVYESGDENTVRVLCIDHRADVYRPR